MGSGPPTRWTGSRSRHGSVSGASSALPMGAPSPIRITTAMRMAGRRRKPLAPTRPPPRATCLSRPVFPGGLSPWTARPPFAFETRFRAAERRVSLVARSDAHGVWQPFVVITEHLGRFAEHPPAVEIPALPQGCRGLRRTITPDLRVSTAEPIPWRRIEEVGEDLLMVRVPGGLAVSLPRRLAPGQPWVGIVEWAVEATTVHRGLRTYEAMGFAQFSLDQFTNKHTW